MRNRLRWVAFEVMKVTLVLSLFVWVQGKVVDSQYEVYASTDELARLQQFQEERLNQLEQARDNSEEELLKTVNEVETVREHVARQAARQSDTTDTIVRLIDERTGTLRDQLERDLVAIQGASHSAMRRTQDIAAQYESLQHRIERRPQEMKRRMIYPVVQLRGNGTVGSGVVVRSIQSAGAEHAITDVLTAYHVVLEILGTPGESRVDDIRFLDPNTNRLQDMSHAGTLVLSDESADIALVRIEMAQPWPYTAQPVPRAEMREVEIFAQVYAVGCPLGNKPLPTPGEISSQEKEVGGQNFWMINAPTFFGNSGGGVFLADSGELIGISSMIYTYGKQQPMVVPHMGLFVPMNSIYEWLSANGEEAVLAPGQGAAPAAAGAAPIQAAVLKTLLEAAILGE